MLERAAKETDPKVREQRERIATELRRRHGCGGGSPSRLSGALSQAWAATFGGEPPAGCVFAAIHEGDPMVGRVCGGLALLEAHLSEAGAFPGGLTAADHDGVRVVLSTRAKCMDLEHGTDDDH